MRKLKRRLYIWLEDYFGFMFKRELTGLILMERFTYKAECPCCGTRKSLLSGPEDGVSVNLMCSACGTSFDCAVIGDWIMLDWVHGPQMHIWGDRKQSVFPSPVRVAKARELMNGG